MELKKKVLWLSLCAPYDTVAHAGGKIHNYYIKNMHKDGRFDIYLISFCYESECQLLDLNQYHISNKIIVVKNNFLKKAFNAESALNPIQKYAGIIPNYQRYFALKEMHQFAKTHEQPDIIILHWTQMVVLYYEIKKWFPKSKFVMIEEDVSFLGYERKINYANNVLKKIFYKIRHDKLKKIELDVLDKGDLIVVNNIKDRKLLVNCDINHEKIFVSTPYFTNYSFVQRKATNNIIYFGAMKRPENYKSVIWFINNVFDKLNDLDVKLIVIGGNPHPSIMKYASDRIKITGFVEDIAPYFSSCLCLVAPLVMGAGIKIKVLEALSAGVPVLTNRIGIEGIPAKADRDYLHCESVRDYVEAIHMLADGRIDARKLSENAKSFIKQSFDPNKMILELMNRIFEC